jgi:outer membrane lipoprotein LolB
VRHGNDGFSGHLDWRHMNEQDELRLSSPLGSTLASIQRDATGVALEISGVRHEASNTADLTERVLGWRLPLEGMQFWIQGKASPKNDAEITRDESGNITRLSQQEWEIEYRDYRLQAGFVLPYRLVMRGANMELRLAVDDWALP